MEKTFEDKKSCLLRFKDKDEMAAAMDALPRTEFLAKRVLRRALVGDREFGSDSAGIGIAIAKRALVGVEAAVLLVQENAEIVSQVSQADEDQEIAA